MLYLASYEISALVTEFFNSGGGYGVLSLSHLTSYAISKNNIGDGIFEQLGGTVVICLFYTETHMRFLKNSVGDGIFEQLGLVVFCYIPPNFI